VHIATDGLPADSNARPILSRALELMSQVIEEGRNAVRGLRSSQSPSMDLERAFAGIQKDVDPANKQSGFRVFVVGPQMPLRAVLRDEVYRIGREALINAFRHARATRIEVTLTYAPNHLKLLVHDNGCGIDSDTLRLGRAGHWGLCGMRERASRIGARLRVFSSLSAGTSVELTVPGRVAFEKRPANRAGWLRRAATAVSSERGT